MGAIHTLRWQVVRAIPQGKEKKMKLLELLESDVKVNQF